MADRRRRDRIHEIVFEADTPTGKWFDIGLLVLIVLSVLVVMLESSQEWYEAYGELFRVLEWIFTIVFTLEYLLRLYVTVRPMNYALSFYGVIDLVAILPSYLSYFLVGSQYFVVIRVLRLLRIFRIFKLGKFLSEGNQLRHALIASRNKITVFLFTITLLIVVIGSLMYLIEGGVENTGFSSIPKSIYWAIVTLTTVGYGDITPQTSVGQFLSAAVMILGYAIIAVPTGIVTSEIMGNNKSNKYHNTQVCRYCAREGHDDDAVYCKHCGARLNEA